MTQDTHQTLLLPTEVGQLGATLYRPASDAINATVIMAHGYGAQRHFRLPAYAERFAAAGLHVLLFDYRGFAESEGTPRHLVSYRQQLKDWNAVLKAISEGAQDLPSDQIVLWGTSYSGGHVISLAANSPHKSQIKAVISQVPMLNFFACSLVVPTWDVIKLSCHGMYDLFRGAFGLSPHYIPTVVESGTCALPGLNCNSGYRALVPDEANWPNQVAAREGVLALAYSPQRTAAKIQAPVWLQASTQDQLIPVKLAKQTAKTILHCELVLVEADHFQIYAPPFFDDLVTRQVTFLQTHLRQTD